MLIGINNPRPSYRIFATEFDKRLWSDVLSVTLTRKAEVSYLFDQRCCIQTQVQSTRTHIYVHSALTLLVWSYDL